ncbi:MAG TPA: J domain-containing protein [Candidatus Hydrogenedentes bacterium]|nr:J domain-containing protein [Candidatus Hydrogenedentota bacterium]HRK33073.1 J domain-containing protein [Candidatus Hydrogenedentota bacterium]
MIPSLNEFLIMAVVIAVLSMTGIWPQIIRGIRQLRGERLEDEAPVSQRDIDLAYKMLGVSPSAPWPEVEQAFRKKAKLHHPDHGGDDDVMRALNDAYGLIKRARKTMR